MTDGRRPVVSKTLLTRPQAANSLTAVNLAAAHIPAEYKLNIITAVEGSLFLHVVDVNTNQFTKEYNLGYGVPDKKFPMDYDGKTLVMYTRNTVDYGTIYTYPDGHAIFTTLPSLGPSGNGSFTDLKLSDGVYAFHAPDGNLYVWDLNKQQLIKKIIGAGQFGFLKGELVYEKLGNIYYQDLLNPVSRRVGVRLIDVESMVGSYGF